jgi:hypothetical protein
LGLASLLGQAEGQIRSAFLGGWPGVCESDVCFDDGQPWSKPPARLIERAFEHQLVSPTCPTDLVYIAIKFPANTGNEALDLRLSGDMEARFEQAKNWASSLICADFFGCDDACLPVGLEIRHYIHQSGPDYLSALRVEKIFGNARKGAKLKGSVKETFHNYSLKNGQDLTIEDIFPEPKKSIPLFWAKVAKSLANNGQCPLTKFTSRDRRVRTDALKPDDLLLSQDGATVVLEAAYPCRPQAVDLAFSDLIALGANPALWGR